MVLPHQVEGGTAPHRLKMVLLHLPPQVEDGTAPYRLKVVLLPTRFRVALHPPPNSKFLVVIMTGLNQGR